MVAPFVTPEQNAEGRASGNTTQARDAKDSKIAKLLSAQDVAYLDMVNAKLSVSVRFTAARTWDMLEERIRILRGKVKPGSRNVSVRELSAAEQQKRIGPRSSRPTDYLKDAEATLARAQAMSEPPSTPSDIPPK